MAFMCTRKNLNRRVYSWTNEWRIEPKESSKKERRNHRMSTFFEGERWISFSVLLFSWIDQFSRSYVSVHFYDTIKTMDFLFLLRSRSIFCFIFSYAHNSVRPFSDEATTMTSTTTTKKKSTRKTKIPTPKASHCNVQRIILFFSLKIKRMRPTSSMHRSMCACVKYSIAISRVYRDSHQMTFHLSVFVGIAVVSGNCRLICNREMSTLIDIFFSRNEMRRNVLAQIFLFGFTSLELGLPQKKKQMSTKCNKVDDFLFDSSRCLALSLFSLFIGNENGQCSTHRRQHQTDDDNSKRRMMVAATITPIRAVFSVSHANWTCHLLYCVSSIRFHVHTFHKVSNEVRVCARTFESVWRCG